MNTEEKELRLVQEVWNTEYISDELLIEFENFTIAKLEYLEAIASGKHPPTPTMDIESAKRLHGNLSYILCPSFAAGCMLSYEIVERTQIHLK